MNMNVIATSDRIMTVGELLDALRALDPDLGVVVKGCDCESDLKSITLHEDGVTLHPYAMELD